MLRRKTSNSTTLNKYGTIGREDGLSRVEGSLLSLKAPLISLFLSQTHQRIHMVSESWARVRLTKRVKCSPSQAVHGIAEARFQVRGPATLDKRAIASVTNHQICVRVGSSSLHRHAAICAPVRTVPVAWSPIRDHSLEVVHLRGRALNPQLAQAVRQAGEEQIDCACVR